MWVSVCVHVCVWVYVYHCVCVYECECMYIAMCVCRRLWMSEEVLEPLTLELWVVVSCLWVLETEPKPSARATLFLAAEPPLQPPSHPHHTLKGNIFFFGKFLLMISLYLTMKIWNSCLTSYWPFLTGCFHLEEYLFCLQHTSTSAFCDNTIKVAYEWSQLCSSRLPGIYSCSF